MIEPQAAALSLMPAPAPATPGPEARDEALAALLVHLAGLGYDFTAPTPATQARVMARPERATGRSLYDLLGWSLPCERSAMDSVVLGHLEAAGMLETEQAGLVRSRIRVSEIFGRLFIHSAYPTHAADSVFLGPDSHRFADYIQRNLDGLRAGALVLDYGAGSGVGGITAAAPLDRARLVLADINPRALAIAAVNARVAGVETQTRLATSLADLDETFDLIVTHPPFMIDEGGPTYRHGGDLHGAALSLEWTLAAVDKLAPGGRFLMHTGVSVVNGRDVLKPALAERLSARRVKIDYRVLDTDIFGEEMSNPAYREVDRIAAVGVRIDVPG